MKTIAFAAVLAATFPAAAAAQPETDHSQHQQQQAPQPGSAASNPQPTDRQPAPNPHEGREGQRGMKMDDCCCKHDQQGDKMACCDKMTAKGKKAPDHSWH